jgi:hypothetical protein
MVMLIEGVDRQPNCLADRLLNGLSQPKIIPHQLRNKEEKVGKRLFLSPSVHELRPQGNATKNTKRSSRAL